MATSSPLPEGVSQYAHDVLVGEGFQYRVDWRHDASAIQTESGKIQIRAESGVNKAHVRRLTEAIRAGAKIDLPAVTEDEHLVYGNHRVPAYRAAGQATIPVIVINARVDGADEDVINRLRMVGVRENARHGLPNSTATAEMATVLARGEGWDNARIARELGIKPGRVSDIVAADKGAKLLAHVGIQSDPPKTVRAALGRASDELNRAPLADLAKLAVEAGLSPKEIRALAASAKEAGADDDAVRLIADERASLRTRVAGTDSPRPPYPAQLRQRLGFINGKQANPQLLVERSAASAAEHLTAVETAISVLTAVRDLMVTTDENAA